MEKKLNIFTWDIYLQFVYNAFAGYFDKPLLLKGGDRQWEDAYVFSLEHYLYVYLPKLIDINYNNSVYFQCLEYAEIFLSSDEYSKHIEYMRRAIDAQNERYLLAREGLEYLKSKGEFRDVDIIRIQYTRGDDVIKEINIVNNQKDK